jgi:hypothetical protein
LSKFDRRGRDAALDARRGKPDPVRFAQTWTSGLPDEELSALCAAQGTIAGPAIDHEVDPAGLRLSRPHFGPNGRLVRDAITSQACR